MPSEGSVVPLYLGNMSKPSNYQMSHHNAGPAAGPKAVPPTIDPSVGDWLCPCGNWNWAKRTSCNMCKGSKEAANLGATRNGAAGGFIEFDHTEDERRKMRAYEAQQATARSTGCNLRVVTAGCPPSYSRGDRGSHAPRAVGQRRAHAHRLVQAASRCGSVGVPPRLWLHVSCTVRCAGGPGAQSREEEVRILQALLVHLLTAHLTSHTTSLCRPLCWSSPRRPSLRSTS